MSVRRLVGQNKEANKLTTSFHPTFHSWLLISVHILDMMTQKDILYIKPAACYL